MSAKKSDFEVTRAVLNGALSSLGEDDIIVTLNFKPEPDLEQDGESVEVIVKAYGDTDIGYFSRFSMTFESQECVNDAIYILWEKGFRPFSFSDSGLPTSRLIHFRREHLLDTWLATHIIVAHTNQELATFFLALGDFARYFLKDDRDGRMVLERGMFDGVNLNFHPYLAHKMTPCKRITFSIPIKDILMMKEANL